MSFTWLVLSTAVAGTWRPTRTLAGPFAVSSPPEPPVVAVDAAGNGLAAWDSTGDIRWSARPVGGAWTRGAAVPGAFGWGVAAARGSDGTGAIAWVTPGTEFTPSELKVSVAPLGTAFPAGTAVTTDAASPAVGVLGDGTVLLAWSDAAGVWSASLAPGGSWSAPAALAAGGAGVSLDVNDAGDAVVAWSDAGGVQAAARPAGGVFEAPVALSTAAYGPVATVDGDGGAAVGFVEGSAYRVVRRPAGGSWGAPEAVSPAGQVVGWGAVEADDAGDLAVAWQATVRAGTAVFLSESLAQGPWSTASRLSARTDAAGAPTLAFAPDGATVAVGWVDDANAVARVTIVSQPAGSAPTAVRAAIGGTSWGSIVPIDAGGATVDAVWAVQSPGNPNSATIQAKTHE